MAINSLSKPQLVRFVCSEHGERVVAPVSMNVQCVCGRACTPDVGAWVTEVLAHQPDADVAALALEAGVPVAAAKAALDEL